MFRGFGTIALNCLAECIAVFMYPIFMQRELYNIRLKLPLFVYTYFEIALGTDLVSGIAGKQNLDCSRR